MEKTNLDILHRISSAVQQSFDLNHVYDTALDMALTLKDVDLAFIYLITEDRKEAALQAHRNLPEDYISKASVIPYPKGITWSLLNSGQVFNEEDIQDNKDVGPAGKQMGHRRGLGIPIILEGVVMGVIWLASYKTGKFSDEEVKLNVSIGNNIGIAIAKAKLYKEMEERVRIRTAELEESNQLLLKEIEERKRAEVEIRKLREQHELVNAINKVLKKMQYIESSLPENLADEIVQEIVKEKALHEALSDREYRVMLKIAAGMSIKDIAKEKYLSTSTISTNRARILDKLNLQSNADLIHYTIKHNLVD
jgi:GAF domain-containing protein/DNA-binding CsgD family transcriptional regulator